MRTAIPPQFSGYDLQQLLTLELTSGGSGGAAPAASEPDAAPSDVGDPTLSVDGWDSWDAPEAGDPA